MGHCIWILLMSLSLVVLTKGHEWDNDQHHPKSGYNDFVSSEKNRVMTDWKKQDKKRMEQAMQQAKRIMELQKQAKNVIFIMGDGMGISTLTAARVYLSQSRNHTGDDAQLSWDKMPYTAFSKTYSVNRMTPDSAPTATAMVSGEKTVEGTIGVNQNTVRSNCSSSKGNELKSILHYFIEDGKWAGVVSTARITHASPAATYASTADRDWESDSDLTEEAMDNGCKDIAAQLIDGDLNKQIRVLLGGGRAKFFPNDMPDTEYPDKNGTRSDGRDLIAEWKSMKATEGIPADEYKYVDDLTNFNAVDENKIQYLMGLFEMSHMQYHLDRPEDPFGEPSLSDMVEKAIKILQRSSKGYFLFVESGRIDHAHHANLPMKALADTVEMSDAVQKAMDLTKEDDTLIVISADHSHVFTLAGYPYIDTNILGFDDRMDGKDGKPYAVLGYTNGPGYVPHRVEFGNATSDEQPRVNLTELQANMTEDKDFVWDAGVWLDSETHAGEDVAIFARGPMAHLFTGVQEQSYIGNVMMYASCAGTDKGLCNGEAQEFCPHNGPVSAAKLHIPCTLTMTIICVILKLLNL